MDRPVFADSSAADIRLFDGVPARPDPNNVISRTINMGMFAGLSFIGTSMNCLSLIKSHHHM
jgi:hypothetical protein